MAQRRRRPRLRSLMARYGLRPGGAGVAALVVAVLAAAAGGFALQAAPTDVVVRADAGAGVVQGADEAEGDDGLAERPQEEEKRYVVHVDGAVAAPGVFTLQGVDVRVYDAVDAAGGLLDDADTSSVNLAEPLADGAKIHIPREGEQAEGEMPALPGQAQTSGATGVGDASTLVNINQASEEELQQLPGIGEVMARTICEDRAQNGPFASCEDLMRVSGIGEKKFERVRGLICV